ncbi:MAG: hypothetical protein Kilf2KO_27180 [Rhodospirillales bacterium]
MLTLAGLLFAGFLANLVVGKLAIMEGATQSPGLGDVGEFLLLFAAVLLFIAGCLRREAAAKTTKRSDRSETDET